MASLTRGKISIPINQKQKVSFSRGGFFVGGLELFVLVSRWAGNFQILALFASWGVASFKSQPYLRVGQLELSNMGAVCK